MFLRCTASMLKICEIEMPRNMCGLSTFRLLCEIKANCMSVVWQILIMVNLVCQIDMVVWCQTKYSCTTAITLYKLYSNMMQYDYSTMLYASRYFTLFLAVCCQTTLKLYRPSCNCPPHKPRRRTESTVVPLWPLPRSTESEFCVF